LSRVAGLLACPSYLRRANFILVPRASWGPEHEDQEVLGASGDRGFEVPYFRTSGHFWYSTTFLISFTCSCRSVNDCKFSWFKALKRQPSKLLLNRKWPEVLKSRTSNPVSPEPPGPRAQAPRRLWGRGWANFSYIFVQNLANSLQQKENLGSAGQPSSWANVCTYQEGLIRVNHQPLNGLKSNRLPSKKVIFYRQQSKMQININRQTFRGISNLTISSDLHGLLAPEASFKWTTSHVLKTLSLNITKLYNFLISLVKYFEILYLKGQVNLQNTTFIILIYTEVNIFFNSWDNFSLNNGQPSNLPPHWEHL